jgi:hypothetical protein
MMMRLLIGLGLCMLMEPGCTKDQNEFIPAPGTDTVWVTQVTPGDAVMHLADTLSSIPSTVSVDLSLSDSVTISGMRLNLPAGWQTAAGAPFTGQATLQASLLQSPGGWIRNFIPTTYGGRLVRTNAVLNFSVQAGGVSLQPTGTVLVSIPTTGSMFEMDSLISGSYSGSLLQWTGMVDYSYFQQTSGEVSFAMRQTGWLMYGTPLPDTVNANNQLVVSLPNQFTNANSAVFCWLSGYSSLVSLTGNYASKTFMANNLPAGSPVTIISITLTGGTFYLGTQNVTLTNGTLSVSISPNIQTLSSLTSYLEQL